MLARLMRGERVIHLADARTDDSYRKLPPQVQRFFEVSGIRTLLVVPLRKDDAVLGFITAFRQEIRPFSDKQSRSVRKPGRASRRLHAGCRSGSIRASPELIPEEGSPPGFDIA